MSQDASKCLRFLPLILVIIVAPSCFLAGQVYTWASVDGTNLFSHIQKPSFTQALKVRLAEYLIVGDYTKQPQRRNVDSSNSTTRASTAIGVSKCELPARRFRGRSRW